MDTRNGVCSNAEILLSNKENELLTHSTNTSLQHSDVPRQPATKAQRLILFMKSSRNGETNLITIDIRLVIELGGGEN